MKAERNVLAEVHNPYVVKLLYSFQVRGIHVNHSELSCRSAGSQLQLRCLLLCADSPATCLSALQDDEYLYLIMEYLPGGDVMVWGATWLMPVSLPCSRGLEHARPTSHDTDLFAAADAADAEGHPERGGHALLHRGDGAGAGVHPPPQLHPQVLVGVAVVQHAIEPCQGTAAAWHKDLQGSGM